MTSPPVTRRTRCPRLAGLLLALAGAQPASAGWVEGQIGVRDDNTKVPIAIFVNTQTGVGLPPGRWHLVDMVAVGVPRDAKSVFLSGLLAITHGKTAQTCDLTVSIRAPGDQLLAGNYIGQVVETDVGAGQRSNLATWAPMRDGRFEFQWNRNTGGRWPQECAYLINLSAQAYVR